MRYITASFLVLGLLILPARAQDNDTADSFFGPAKIHTVHLKVTRHAWNLMEPYRRPRPAPVIAAEQPPPNNRGSTSRGPPPPTTPAPGFKNPPIEADTLPPNNFGFVFAYVKARFECDGQTLDDVGLRFKGHYSFESAPRPYQRPYKLDFNRFVPGQKFRGLTSLNLSNNAHDPTNLREALSYYCYTRAGVPTPRTALAALYLTIEGVCDREYSGIFTLVEEPDDKQFLKSRFDTARGLLFKPEGMRGLPYLGERFEPYAERFRSKAEVDPQLARRFIEFVKLVNYADDDTFHAKIEEHLDVDNVLRYVAASVLISNLDSFLVTNHNFYLHLHPRDRRVRILPWDMNLSFGGYQTPGSADSQIHLSIARPWAGDHNRLLERLMAVEEYQCTYRQYLWRFMEDFFNPQHMNDVMGAMELELAKATPRGARAGAIARLWAGGEGIPMRTYVARKTKVVRAQLDGNTSTAYVPRPNPPFAFRWGIRAPQEYGNLPLMAKAIRRKHDADGDFSLSPRELRDAAAAFFFDLVEESNPGAIHLKTAATGLNPIVTEKQATSRGFWSMGANPRDTGSAGFIWATAIFRDADANLDGHVTLDETTDYVSRLFCLCDQDQNGLLNEREIVEALDTAVAPAEPWRDAVDAGGFRRKR